MVKSQTEDPTVGEEMESVPGGPVERRGQQLPAHCINFRAYERIDISRTCYV
jgi:hypothetical protein